VASCSARAPVAAHRTPAVGSRGGFRELFAGSERDRSQQRDAGPGGPSVRGWPFVGPRRSAAAAPDHYGNARNARSGAPPAQSSGRKASGLTSA